MDVDLGKKKVSLGLWDYSSRDGEDRWLKISYEPLFVDPAPFKHLILLAALFKRM
jgi:hypothetical protein